MIDMSAEMTVKNPITPHHPFVKSDIPDINAGGDVRQ